MKKSGILLGLIVYVLGLAVPAGSSVNLKSDLLTLSQLPKGWVTASASSAELPGCKATALPAKPTTQANATFNYRALKGFPQLVEVLAAYTNIDKGFNSLTSGLNGCKNVTGNKNGKSFTTTVSKMAFSSYGDQSAAFHASIKASGLLVAIDILVVRKGKVLLELQEGNNNSSVSLSTFHGFATAAVRKLTSTTTVSSTKASQQFLATATASKAAYLTWRAAIKGKTTVSQVIGPCDTYAAALTNFDNAILRIAVTGKTETDIQTLVADDRVVIKDLEAVKTETAAEIRKDAAQLIATGETAISAGDVVRSDLGLPPS